MINGEMNGLVSFGDWVRQRRKVLDLTQAALAEQVGCAVVTIKKIEQDERRPSPQMAHLLADRLAIPQSMRDDFVKMGRGQFVPSISSPQEPLLPPVFLQHMVPSTQKDQPPFVARHHELAQLNSHLAATLDGNGRVVFILGEAGCGKTRLMAEFARRAQEVHLDLVVAGGHCNAQAGSGVPYLPFRDMLNMLTGDLEAGWMAGHISREQVQRLWALLPHTIQAITERGPTLINILVPGTPLVRRLIPYISNQAHWLEDFESLLRQQKKQPANLEQSQLLEEVTQVLRVLAVRQPLLLLLDDLQWVDDASKNLLFHLGRRLAGSRILVLGAYRPSEITLGRPTGSPGQTEQHPLEPVINEFKRYFGDILLNIDQSVPAEGRAFVNAFLDSEPNGLDETFRENLFQHTRGHPLFTGEIIRHMKENGNLIQDKTGQWVESAASAGYELPARVEAVIEQRINRLDETLRDILAVASVEGELFTVQVVARILALEERPVLRRLARDLEQQHRLVQEHSEVTVGQQLLNRYQFGHALFQEYLYHRLSQGERQLYHLEVATALEEILFAGYPVENRVRPLQPYSQAEEAPERAYLDRLDMFGPSLAHHFWHGREWFKAAGYAMRAGQRAMQVYALREAIGYFNRALQALDNISDPPVEFVYEAIIHWVEAAFKFRPYAEQLEQLARAEKIAREQNDKPRLVKALHWTANVYLARGLWTQAGPALMECLSLAGELGNDRLSVRPTYFKALMTTFENPRGALALLDRTLDLAAKYEDRHIEALSLATKAQTHAHIGEFGRARAAMQQAHEALHRTDSPLTESDVNLLTGWTYLAMGDAELGLEYGQRGVEKAIATDNMDCICYGFDCVGFSNLELQRIAEATQAFKEAIERSEISGAIIPRLLGQAGLAMSQFCSGRVEAIQDLEKALADMQAYNDHVGAAGTAQMLGTCLMQSGDLEYAESYLNMARDFYRRMEMFPYLVRTLSSLAQLFEKQRRLAEVQEIQAEVEIVIKEKFV